MSVTKTKEMEKDNYITDVVFRCDKSGDFKDVVFALLPHEVSTTNGLVTSYTKIGQHSSANYSGCIGVSRAATEKEYKDLKKEMEGLGYNLKVVKKQNYDKFLESYKKVNKR